MMMCQGPEIQPDNVAVGSTLNDCEATPTTSLPGGRRATRRG
jgi:hypothetical protein